MRGLWAAAYSVPAVLILLIVLFAGGTPEWMNVIIILAAIAAMTMMAGPISRRTRVVKADNVTVKQYGFSLMGEMFARLEGRFPIINRFRRHSAESLKPVVLKTGVSYDVEHAVTLTTRLMVLVLPISVIAAAILGIFVSPFLLAILAAPLAIYLAPNVTLRLKIMERKTKTEEEVAYFLCYVNIMQAVGHDLYHAFENLGGVGIFPSMEKDSREIIKRVRMLGITKSESLVTYADNHPFEKFRDFIDGYLAKIAAVGGVPQYTEAKAKLFFQEYQGAWKRYEKSAQEVFSSIMIISIVLPLMIMLTAMIGTKETTGNLMAIGTVISPVISMAMVTMLNGTQPSTGTYLPMPIVGPIGGAFIGVMLLLSGVGAGTTLAVSFLVMAVVNIAFTRTKIRSIAIIDRMLPEFMRDVTEMSKTGANINQIITQQSSRNAYKKQFNDILAKMAADLRMGLPLKEAVANAKVRSMNFRFLMFILERTYMTGGGSTGIFSTITEFVAGIHQTKEMVRKSLSSLTMMVYISPFLIMGIAHIMVGMMSSGLGDAGDTAVPGAMLTISLGLADNDKFLTGIELMAAMTAIPMGFVAAKISSFTIRNMMPVAITSMMTILAIEFTETLIGVIGIF